MTFPFLYYGFGGNYFPVLASAQTIRVFEVVPAGLIMTPIRAHERGRRRERVNKSGGYCPIIRGALWILFRLEFED
jgi:hypothetical protein